MAWFEMERLQWEAMCLKHPQEFSVELVLWEVPKKYSNTWPPTTNAAEGQSQ